MTRHQGVIIFSTTAFGAVWTYFSIVVLLGEDVLGVSIGLKLLCVILVIGLAGIYSRVQWLLKRQLVSESGFLKIGLALGVTVPCLIAADVAYSVYLSSHIPKQYSEEEERLGDRNAWIGEWYPRFYYPTENNFRLHKPKFTLIGDHYGIFYRPHLMRSPTLASSVFQKQHVSITINELGFRETNLLEQCTIFALGDSFAFGWGVTDDKVWTKVLDRAIGTCVYNLGIHDASPKQELLLLKDMLEKEGPRLRVRHLLWMIYEGNDLEYNYEDRRPISGDATISRLFKGTIMASVYEFAFTIKKEALINRLRTHQLSVTLPLGYGDADNHYMVDGIRLATPLYHSPMHGYVLLFRPYLEWASKPESYVLNHPNRPLLDQVFKDMAALASKYHFKVTVVIAPTVVRLYAPYFSDLNDLTREPHFINYVESLSRDSRFDSINLFTAMQPYAREELLYFRDDDHWNERGNRVVAEIIQNRLQSKRR